MANVFTVLLAKACVSMCVLLSFCLHENDSESINISWYACTLGFSLLLLVKLNSQRVSLSDMVSILIATFFWCHTTLTIWIIQSYSPHTRSFITDSVSPYVQYRKILNCVIHDVLNLLQYLKQMNEYLGISIKKFVIFLVYLSGHAVIFIFLFNLIFLATFQHAYVIFSENFFYTFDVNSTMAYPVGYEHPENLDTKTYNFPVGQLNHYLNHENGKCERINQHDLYNVTDGDNVSFPYTYVNIQRYVGEDVLIHCRYICIVNTSVTSYYLRTIWTLNGSIVKTNRNIQTDLVTSNVSQNFQQIHSEIKIRRIKETQFGVYSCIHVTHEDYNVFESVYKKLKIAVYNITLMPQKLTVLYRTVGNLIASQNFFWYHTSDDIADVYATYVINGRPVEDVCPGYSTKFCSVGAEFIRTSKRIGNSHMKWYGETIFPYIDIDEDFTGDLKKAVVYFCMCNEAYGIHKVRFVRNMVSKTTNRTMIVDVEHPYVFLVLPKSQRSLFRYTNHSDLYTDVLDLVEQDVPLEKIEEKFEHVAKAIHATEQDAAYFANTVQSVLILFIIILYFVVMRYVSRVYFYLFIQLPMRRFLPLPGVKLLSIKDKTLELEYYLHDVFVSFSQDEYDFVSEVLIPFLEDSCNVKVCHPDRDMGKGPRISSYTEHITKSRYIITVLSQGYKTDSLCQNLQLELIIKPLLCEQRRQQDGVMFILYDEGAALPDILRWMFSVQSIDWRRNCSQEWKLNFLKRWLDSLRSE